jgi:hypothetical protein
MNFAGCCRRPRSLHSGAGVETREGRQKGGDFWESPPSAPLPDRVTVSRVIPETDNPGDAQESPGLSVGQLGRPCPF